MSTCRLAVLSVTFSLPEKHANHVRSPEITRPLGFRKLISQVGCMCPFLGQVRFQGLPPRSRPKEECTQRSLRMTRPLCPPKSRAPTSCSLRGPLAIWVRVPAGVRLQLLHYPSPQCPPSLPTLTHFECHLGGDSVQPHPHPHTSTRRASANLIPMCSQPDPTRLPQSQP